MSTEQNQLIIQFLERVVDENIKATEKLTHVKFMQEEQRREVAEVLAVLKNGLKDDIKKHMSDETSKSRKDYEKLLDKFEDLFDEIKEHRERAKEIDEVLKDIRKKGMWFRGAIALIVALATIAGAFITLSRVAGWPQAKQPTSIVQPQNPAGTTSSNTQPNTSNTQKP